MLIYIFVIPLVIKLTFTNVNGNDCTPFKSITDIPNEMLEHVNGQIKNVIQDVFGGDVSAALGSYYKEYELAMHNEDVYLNITQLISKYDYPVEEHEVKTGDGYLLNMIRLPNDGPPVLMFHGMCGSSDDFFTIGSTTAIGYLLADAGYDVWLGNARGNKHSRRHISLSPSCKEFWDFSWDEIGRYDLSAMIDYVLDKTSEKQLTYLGYSQGATAYYVLISEQPEYNKKIKLMIAFSATAFWPSDIPFMQMVGALHAIDFFKFMGIYEYSPRNALLEYITKNFCNDAALATAVCGNSLYMASGYDITEINFTAMPIVFGHTPSGMSTKQLIHYWQNADSGEFTKYDYGLKNMEIYGSVTPPSYRLEKITGPMVVYYSHNDKITTIKTLNKFLSKLDIEPMLIEIKHRFFTHADYVFAKQVKELVYDSLIDIIDKFAESSTK